MSFIVEIFAGIKDYVLPSMRYMRKTWSTRVERRGGISRSEDRKDGNRCAKRNREKEPVVTRIERKDSNCEERERERD